MRVRRQVGTMILAGGLVMASAAVAVAAAPFVEDDAETLYVLSGESVGDYYGWVGANIGDIDNDGAADLAIPAILEGAGGPVAGRVYVHSGATGDLMHVADGTDFELFGYSVAGAGDVDADGVPDYVIGARSVTTDAPSGRALVKSGADHSVIHELTADDATFFGSGVSGAGDVDGDGHAEILVGASLSDFNGDDSGRVYLFDGSDGSVMWTFDGRKPGDLLGSGVGIVGDVDGDTVPDSVVGAFGNGGNAYVLSGATGRVIHRLRPKTNTGSNFGQFFASGPGDVDADGVPDVFVADYNAGRGDLAGTGAAYVYSGRTGRLIHLLTVDEEFGGYGPGRGVGDVNHDGHADLIVAAYTSNAGAELGGKTYLISGADASVLRTFTDTVPHDYSGVDALGLGDVNGDGYTDFVITAPGPAFDGVGPGIVYVVAGTSLP
jgi:hypothetical protein